MLTPYQRNLLGDIGSQNGYGLILAAWKGHQEIFREKLGAKPGNGLTLDLALTFVDQVYVLADNTKNPHLSRL